MLDSSSVAFVFESGLVRFDQDGVLHVLLAHTAGTPHPLLIQELEAGVALPADARSARIGGEGDRAWRPRTGLPEVAERPEGIELSFEVWDWAQVEMSGDLTVFLKNPTGLPDWVRPGYVHRLAQPGESVGLWRDSAPPPQVKPKERARLEDPMEDWKEEHAAPAPGPSGRWVGGAPQATARAGCGPALVLLGVGLSALSLL